MAEEEPGWEEVLELELLVRRDCSEMTGWRIHVGRKGGGRAFLKPAVSLGWKGVCLGPSFSLTCEACSLFLLLLSLPPDDFFRTFPAGLLIGPEATFWAVV